MFSRETMTVRRWYHNSVEVPGFTSRGYRPFVASSMGIVRSILKQRLGRPVSVLFRRVPTAYADPDKGQIVINEYFLGGNFGMYGRADADTTLGILMGIVVHEAAHFAYSPKDMRPWGAYIRKHTKRPYVEPLAFSLCNTIEDIFIEAEVERQVPTLAWTLDIVNRKFFATHNLDTALLNAAAITAAPLDAVEAAAVLNVLIYAKTRPAVMTTPYIEALFTEVRSARNTGRIEDRFALALSIYEKLMERYGTAALPEHADDGEKSEAGDGGTGSGGLPQPGELGADEEQGEDAGASDGASEAAAEDTGTSVREAEALERIKKLSEGLTAVAKRERVPAAETSAAREIEVRMERLEEAEITLEDSSGVGSEDGLIYVERVPQNGDAIEADERYDRLVEIGRQRASVNRPYGLDRSRGTTIRKLHRIATDQKIFADPVPMSSYKPMQVILLVDCSGSMCTYKDGVTRVMAASRAALGAARALVEAHCEVAVYGHTACAVMDNDVTIYKVKTFSEPVTVLPSRLGSLAVGTENLVENKDGYALRYVAKKFTSHGKRRLLIVLSDGSPQAPGYSGASANCHTRAAVDAIRATGIDVLSISITEAARFTNDYIYGEESNVFNTDPNVIEGIVKSLLLK